jgi:L-seryl-tRNA(Ser) seleniumtransferase
MQTDAFEELPRPPTGALWRRLPAVSTILDSRPFRSLCRDHGTALVKALLRERLDVLRAELRAGRLDGPGLSRAVAASALARAVSATAQRLLEPSPRVVINATGVIAHTNLGRSPLSRTAAQRLVESATRYLDLEYDLPTGERGSRLQHLEPLVARLFPGQGFVVVNNNAAAILLTLRALARGREVLVSRGELVEIGGSFRIPEILAASGARLREVGTTNRTRVADYREALSKRTAVVLKVHASNFRIVGFSEEASLAELSGWARAVGVPLVVDWGSGDLVDLAPLGIHDEKPVSRILDEGADLVTFSADKLLGGPQAGFVVGRPDLVQRLRRDPLARVLRVDRLMVAVLRETLGAYVRGRQFEEVPTLRMLSLSPREIGLRAARALRAARRISGTRRSMSVIDGVSRTGGGSSPAGERPTRLLAVEGRDGDETRLERALRLGAPPVIGRLQDGKLLLDLRTVMPDQDGVLIERLSSVLSQSEVRPR